MRHHTLIVSTNSRVEPRFLTKAVADAFDRAPRDAVRVVRIMIPAVLPATLPISAWPTRLADRLSQLREAAEQTAASLRTPCRVEIVPCRGVPALLSAVWPVDALVLVGSAGWGVRRAARGVAPDLVIVPARSTARRRRVAPSAHPKALTE
jgi:hypothetical protein